MSKYFEALKRLEEQGGDALVPGLSGGDLEREQASQMAALAPAGTAEPLRFEAVTIGTVYEPIPSEPAPYESIPYEPIPYDPFPYDPATDEPVAYESVPYEAKVTVPVIAPAI